MSTAPGGLPVVVGVDGSPASNAAVEWAARDAARRGAALKLLSVQTPPVVMAFPEVPVTEAFTQWQEERGRELLEAARAIASDAAGEGRLAVTSEVVYGPAVAALAEASNDAQMIVLGSRGHGALARSLLGSVSTGLAHHARCPVAIIREELAEHPAQAPVVVGVDGSPASEHALAIAFEQASFRGVDLVAVHAWDDTGVFEFPGADWAAMQEAGEQILSERLSGWQERYPDVPVRRVVVGDRPAHQLVEQSESAQLLVVGSRGRGGFTGMLLGSVSTSVVHAARTPVIVARR